MFSVGLIKPPLRNMLVTRSGGAVTSGAKFGYPAAVAKVPTPILAKFITFCGALSNTSAAPPRALYGALVTTAIVDGGRRSAGISLTFGAAKYASGSNAAGAAKYASGSNAGAAI
jgi:hypothetical protein